MKKFFAIYLSILCFLPMLANAVLCSSTDQPANCVTCVQAGGWYWDDLDSRCRECSSDKYHTTCTDATDCDAECTPVTTNPRHFRNNDGTGQIPCPDQTTEGIIETTDAQTYIGNCGCTDQYRNLIHSSDGNKHFYYCGICGLGLQPSLMQNVIGSLYECNCATAHANHVYGTNVSNNGTRVECACAGNANGNAFLYNGLCMCGTSETAGQDPYPSINNNGITTYSCCPGYSTYDSSKGDCVCNVQFAKITRDANNNNKLTECECITGTVYHGNSCKCQANRYVTFDNNSNPNVNWGETYKYLKSCTTCPNNSSTDTDQSDNYNYPRFCKCNSGYYQDEPSSTGNPTPTCHQCPTQTTTPLPGSVGSKSCRLRNDTNFSISNTHTKSMRLIPQGATILPIYTNPYTTNNNNTQSQYTH